MGRLILSARGKPVDVYRSDFIQDSGTPLQWLLGWEVVGERERALAAATTIVAAAAVMMVSGIPIAAGVVRAVIAGGSDA